MQIQIQTMHTSEVRGENKEGEQMLLEVETRGGYVGRSCHGDNLPSSIFEDDHLTIHRFFGIQALDIRRVQRI